MEDRTITVHLKDVDPKIFNKVAVCLFSDDHLSIVSGLAGYFNIYEIPFDEIDYIEVCGVRICI